jgi:Family of unknown function (DUF6427)
VFAGLLNKGVRGSLVLVLAIFTVAYLTTYFSSRSLEEDTYPNLFYNYFADNLSNKFLIVSLNFVFILIGVYFISLISVNQEIVEKQNYFPVFLYLVLASACANPFHVTPQIFSNVFILFSIYKLLDTYRKDGALRTIFDAALWLSISSFITISTIICFPLFFIILFILRPFSWREWAVALLGFFTPIYLYECMAYLSNFNRGYLFNACQLYFSSFSFPSSSEYYITLMVTLFTLLVVSIIQNLNRGFGNTVKKQRAKTILLWLLLFSTFGFFSGGANGSSIIATYAFPLSFFIGDFLYNLKQIKVANTLLTLVLLGALVIFLAQLAVI